MLSFYEAIARLPDARKEGATWRARCPAHRGRDRNLAVWSDRQGFARFKCFSRGCSTKAIIDAISDDTLTHAPSIVTLDSASIDSLQLEKRITLAREIWSKAQPAHGTIAELYVRARGWTGELPWAIGFNVPADPQIRFVGLAIPASIRFAPKLRHLTGVYLPTIIAAVEDANGAIVGINRTYLKPDGTGKAEVQPNKLSLGRVRSAAVRLTAGARELVVCEGIETGLAILQSTGRHVWVALGTANLAHVALPSFVHNVIIAADNDLPGLQAAAKAADAYTTRGYETRIVRPRDYGADFNDVLRRRC